MRSKAPDQLTARAHVRKRERQNKYRVYFLPKKDIFFKQNLFEQRGTETGTQRERKKVKEGIKLELIQKSKKKVKILKPFQKQNFKLCTADIE